MAFFALFWAALGLSIGLVLGSGVALVVCSWRATVLGAWDGAAIIVMLRSAIFIVGGVYAWVAVFGFSRDGVTWRTFADAASGSGVGAEYLSSLTANFFAAASGEAMIVAISIALSVLSTGVLLSQLVLVLFRWSLHLYAVEHGEPEKTWRSRAIAWHRGANLRDVSFDAFALCFTVIASPLILPAALSALQNLP